MKLDPELVLEKMDWYLKSYKEFPDWQERAKNRMAILVQFLNDHNLTTEKISFDRGGLSPDFCIRVKDLTEEGLEFFKNGVQKWTKTTSKNTTKPLTANLLEKELRRMRNSTR